jgi:hypothetical protein
MKIFGKLKCIIYAHGYDVLMCLIMTFLLCLYISLVCDRNV